MALRDPPVRHAFSLSFQHIFSYLASGCLLPGGEPISHPLKDYPVNLFSSLTDNEEFQLAKYFRDKETSKASFSSLESVLLVQKSLQPDPKILQVVKFAQQAVITLAYDGDGWDKLFNGSIGNIT